MKIICKDNFDRETVSDRLIAENVHEIYAKVMVDALNNRFSSSSSCDWFKAVPDDHKLYTFQP